MAGAPGFCLFGGEKLCGQVGRVECFRRVKTGGEGRARGQRSGEMPGPRAGTPPEAPPDAVNSGPPPPRRAALAPAVDPPDNTPLGLAALLGAARQTGRAGIAFVVAGSFVMLDLTIIAVILDKFTDSAGSEGLLQADNFFDPEPAPARSGSRPS